MHKLGTNADLMRVDERSRVKCLASNPAATMVVSLFWPMPILSPVAEAIATSMSSASTKHLYRILTRNTGLS